MPPIICSKGSRKAVAICGPRRLVPIINIKGYNALGLRMLHHKPTVLNGHLLNRLLGYCRLANKNFGDGDGETMKSRKGMSKNPIWGRRSVVVFDFSGVRCAVSSKRVREVVLMPMLSRAPGLPRILEGVMNLEGTAVPVLRLDRLFGLAESKPELYTPLIVLRETETPVAFLVDKILEVKSIAIGDIMPFKGEDAFNGCIESELTIEGETIHLLSVDKVLLEREKRCIAEFSALEQERLGGLEGAPQ